VVRAALLHVHALQRLLCSGKIVAGGPVGGVSVPVFVIALCLGGPGRRPVMTVVPMN
jgi:hypothetical protein